MECGAYAVFATNRVEDRKNKFKIAMRAYFKATKDTQAETIFAHTNTWEEVRMEAQKALDLRYQQNGKRNFLRRSIRAVGDTASRLEFLTVLIPSGDYMGVLCGGLKLVYNVRVESKSKYCSIKILFNNQNPQTITALKYKTDFSSMFLGSKSHERHSRSHFRFLGQLVPAD